MEEPQEEPATESLISSAGWTAPSGAWYGTSAPRVELPLVSAKRGGISFDVQAPSLFTDMIRREINRAFEAVQMLQRLAVEEALLVGQTNGWDVHIYERAPQFYSVRASENVKLQLQIGIEFTPMKYSVPVIISHPDHDATYDWD